MEDKKYKIADLQEKSEEWKIPFSNLLAGFVLEEFMLRFSASEFNDRLLLRNGYMFGLEQYRKKNILKLDFFCEPDENIPQKLSGKKRGEPGKVAGYRILTTDGGMLRTAGAV
jgi:hypothetical protein